jgi:hypothetical protein
MSCRRGAWRYSASNKFSSTTQDAASIPLPLWKRGVGEIFFHAARPLQKIVGLLRTPPPQQIPLNPPFPRGNQIASYLFRQLPCTAKEVCRMFSCKMEKRKQRAIVRSLRCPANKICMSGLLDRGLSLRLTFVFLGKIGKASTPQVNCDAKPIRSAQCTIF